MPGAFYITTAIDYPNNPPHLGTAYEKVTADVIARWQRMTGKAVWFLMGNDEHSVKVAQRAKEEGLTPQAWCDRMEAAFKERWAALDISYDDFIRTSEERHKKGVVALIAAVRKANPDDIFLGDYEGLYCAGCEEFKLDKNLVDGVCPQHPNRVVEKLKEKNHFFRLSKYRDVLRKYIEEHPEFVQPEARRNELLNVLDDLQDISISRPIAKTLGWGIPFPGDPDKVVYVWFDALANYITGVGYGSDDALLMKWWPADLHVVGKDITRFHCLIWPAMLMAAGISPAKAVFGHGWVLSPEGGKIGKSLGNVVEPLDVAKLLGPDALRLYLIREIPYGQDGEFTLPRFEDRYNADLANNYGNLVSRLVSMAAKYRTGATETEGRVTDPDSVPSRLKDAAAGAVERARKAMDVFALHTGAEAAFDLLQQANNYIQTSEPWTIAKDPARAAELDRVLYDAIEATRIATILLSAVMPRKTREALRRLGDPEEPTLARTAWGAAGTTLSTSSGDALFPRIEDPAKAKDPKPPKKK